MSRKDLASKSLGQQLGSQADTENRGSTTNYRGEQSALFGEEWIPAIFIGTKRTAHHDQAVYLIWFG